MPWRSGQAFEATDLLGQQLLFQSFEFPKAKLQSLKGLALELLRLLRRVIDSSNIFCRYR